MFYIFCSFTLLVCGKKNIFSNLTNSQELGVLGSLEPEPLEKKQEPEPIGKKIRSRLKKKSGAGDGAAKKFAGSTALKNIVSQDDCASHSSLNDVLTGRSGSTTPRSETS